MCKVITRTCDCWFNGLSDYSWVQQGCFLGFEFFGCLSSGPTKVQIIDIQFSAGMQW